MESRHKEARHGVNLGGWLILERWMTPSLFQGVDGDDEYSFMQSENAEERLRQHRDRFMTEEDWQWLANNKVDLVRLPVGYWVLQDDPPFINAAKYLDWAFAMAHKYHIEILLDLHALKGSQNGHVHSGRYGEVRWQQYWDKHLTTLEALVNRYKDAPALWGLEIINEPKVFGNYWALRRLYRAAYRKIQLMLPPKVYFIFQDGFAPPLFSGVIRNNRTPVPMMDTHFYLFAGKILSRLRPETYDAIRGWVYGSILRLTRRQQPVIVGEWSAVLPQPMFNRQPGSEHLAMVAATIRRQRKAYRHAHATFYWNYKTEGRGMYNYRSLVEDGYISS